MNLVISPIPICVIVNFPEVISITSRAACRESPFPLLRAASVFERDRVSNADRCVSFKQHTGIDKATEGVSDRLKQNQGMYKVQS
jgi:hypothetical protein